MYENVVNFFLNKNSPSPKLFRYNFFFQIVFSIIETKLFIHILFFNKTLMKFIENFIRFFFIAIKLIIMMKFDSILSTVEFFQWKRFKKMFCSRKNKGIRMKNVFFMLLSSTWKITSRQDETLILLSFQIS